MELTSPAFEQGGMIPERHTWHGHNIQPALSVVKIPQNACSLVVVMDDPDSAFGPFVHWLAYNIPPVGHIGEGELPGEQGMNDFGYVGYGGPRPQAGTHRYYVRLYALDLMLSPVAGRTKRQIEEAMRSHVLDSTALIGRCSAGWGR
ncbi:MAG: YbhB/YbcL family Raf kinase inhibitor-like protein [Chitinivibrionales bacterium]|nr:YbhB/YbcL family Raf kinase inhibitor-like protein [Chitinivibrionales bacterium]